MSEFDQLFSWYLSFYFFVLYVCSVSCYFVLEILRTKILIVRQVANLWVDGGRCYSPIANRRILNQVLDCCNILRLFKNQLEEHFEII